MNKLLTTANIIGLTLSAGLFASEPIPTDGLPNILKVANQTRNWQILSRFETESSMTGWIVNTGQGRQIAYTDHKGYLVLGELVSPDGVSLNAAYLEKHQPAFDFDKILSKAMFIDLGNTPKSKPVIVFYEPYCPHCSSIYAAMKPYIDAGHPVKLLPVAFISDDNSGRPSSADLLYAVSSAQSPSQAIAQHENKSFSVQPGVSAPNHFLQQLEENFAIMRALDIQGTPAILAPSDSGYNIIKNMVRMSELPAVFNSPRMDSADPRLARFGSDPTTYPVK